MSFCCHSSGLGENRQQGLKGTENTECSPGMTMAQRTWCIQRSSPEAPLKSLCVSKHLASELGLIKQVAPGTLLKQGRITMWQKKKKHKATYFWKSLKHFYNTECKINSRVEEKWWWIIQFQAFKIWQFWATRNRDYKIKRMWHLGSITIGFAYVV